MRSPFCANNLAYTWALSAVAFPHSVRHPCVSFSVGGLGDRCHATFAPLWLLVQRKRRANWPRDHWRVIFICLASPFLRWIAPPPFSMSQTGLTVTRPGHRHCRSACGHLPWHSDYFRTEITVHTESAFPLTNIQRGEWDSQLALWSWGTLNLQLFWWPFCPLPTPDRKCGGEGRRWEQELMRRQEPGWRRRRKRAGGKISPAWQCLDPWLLFH